MLVGNNRSTAIKIAGKSMAILIAMAMQRYDSGRIARWSTSRASLKATGCRHRVSACAVLLRKFVETTQNTTKTQLLPSNNDTFRALVNSENFVPQNRPSTQVINATSFI